MMSTTLVRNCLPELTGLHEPHAGLCLIHFAREYPGSEDKNNAGWQKKVINKVAELPVPIVYKDAFMRWEALVQAQRFQSLQGKLEGRLYIGVVRDNALQAGVTVHQTYGMPMIPGSAVKGVCRAQGKEAGLSAKLLGWLFGAGADDNNDMENEAGLIRFFDAWWVPSGNEKPFVSEVVTPHHQEYYEKEGAVPATDGDSPIPAAQIAVRGSFLFVWSGPEKEAQLVERLLYAALTQKGIGSKRSSGYGLFDASDFDAYRHEQSERMEKQAQIAAIKMKEAQEADARLAREQAFAVASPVLREMLDAGYEDAKKMDAFKGKIGGWLDRMEKNAEESAEIAGLLAEWWKKNAPNEWGKPSTASKKGKEHLQRLQNFLRRQEPSV